MVEETMFYEYQECAMSYEEYAQYLEVKQSPTTQIILDLLNERLSQQDKTLTEQSDAIAEILLNQTLGGE